MLVRTLVAAIAAAGLLVAAGCGDDDPPAAAAAGPVPVEITDTGYAMPERVPGGVIAMRFRNTGSLPHEFALGRIDAGRTAAEAEAVVPALVAGEDGPGWLEDVGGVPLLTPGAEITITRVLEPGTYVAFDAVPDTDGVRGLERGLLTTFVVEGDSGAAPPVPDAVVTAAETRFVVPPLNAGTSTLELRNASGAGRGFLLGSVAPGATEAELARWGEAIGRTGRLPATPVPATFLGAMQTIPDGTSVFVTLELEGGREYGLSDDASGILTRFTPL